MKTAIRCLALLAAFVLPAGTGFAEVVEEETWYGASGKVVKKVTRTYTGADVPGRQSSWEPSWVIRDRQQAQRRHAGVPGPRRYYGSRYRGYGYSCYTPVYYRRALYHCRGSWRGFRHVRPPGWYARAGGGRLVISYSN